MPDGVDPSMHAMEPTPLAPPGHCLTAQPKLSELSKGDHSMLPLRKLGDQDVQRAKRRLVNPWLTNIRFTCARGGHAATVTHPGAPVGYERYETVTTPWCAATRSTMSPMMRLTSKSFGV